MPFKHLTQWFRASPEEEAAATLYTELVARARNETLYRDYGIEDSPRGRLESMMLHLFLYNHTLQDKERIRRLNEMFVRDMDRSFREMGIGDTGVGKRVKRLAGRLIIRLKEYEEAFGDDARLAVVLARELYQGTPPAPEVVAALILKLREHARTLA